MVNKFQLRDGRTLSFAHRGETVTERYDFILSYNSVDPAKEDNKAKQEQEARNQQVIKSELVDRHDVWFMYLDSFGGDSIQRVNGLFDNFVTHVNKETDARSQKGLLASHPVNMLIYTADPLDLSINLPNDSEQEKAEKAGKAKKQHLETACSLALVLLSKLKYSEEDYKMALYALANYNVEIDLTLAPLLLFAFSCESSSSSSSASSPSSSSSSSSWLGPITGWFYN